MPLNRLLFQNAAVTIFAIAGNVPDTVTFKKLEYDGNGQATGLYSAVVTLTALRESLSIEKVDNSNILATDRLYLLPTLNLNGAVPAKDDLLEIDGDVWTIKRVEADPATATYSLHVRK